MKCNILFDLYVWVVIIVFQVLKYIVYFCCDIGYYIVDVFLRKIFVMFILIVKIVYVVYEYVFVVNKEVK